MKRINFCAPVTVAIVMGGIQVSAAGESGSFGTYSTAVAETRLFKANGTQLRCDLFFTSDSGRQWIAPKNSVTGQSIPAFVWQYSGLDPSGNYPKTRAVHSHYTDSKERHWQDVQLTFYKGLRTEGADEDKAKIAYAGAYAFAPRWTDIEFIDITDPTQDKHSKLYDIKYDEPAAKGVSIDDFQALVRELMDDPDRVTLQDIRGVIDAADAAKSGQPIVNRPVLNRVPSVAITHVSENTSQDSALEELPGEVVDLTQSLGSEQLSEEVSLEIFPPEDTSDVAGMMQRTSAESSSDSWVPLDDGSVLLRDVQNSLK
ncbi:hypothetical protein AB833_29990 [Chromatiales bacterium (ex Bugula neritina AB1)]|nr:hypothetical protein AB833_29990 [Chromatiales bacterium (ex Bugula neritina AB1)]